MNTTKKNLLTILLFFIYITLLHSNDKNLFNYTIIPYQNLIDNKKPTVIGTGLISSNLNSVSGIQLAPIFNTSEKNGAGFQLSGVTNLNEDSFKGVQLTAFVNKTDNLMLGLQWAGFINYSGSLVGLQASSLLNSTDDLKGVQIGLVNRANKSVGVQLGLINISDDLRGNTIALGLVNLYKFGILDLSAVYDSNGNIIYYYESGTSKFFSQFYLELNNEIGEDIDYRGVVWGTGVGYKILKTTDIVLGVKRSFKYLFTKPTIQLSTGLNYKRFSLIVGIRGDLAITGYNDDFFVDSHWNIQLNDYTSLYYTGFIGIKTHINNSYFAGYKK